jgi:hypothetical protein
MEGVGGETCIYGAWLRDHVADRSLKRLQMQWYTPREMPAVDNPRLWGWHIHPFILSRRMMQERNDTNSAIVMGLHFHSLLFIFRCIIAYPLPMPKSDISFHRIMPETTDFATGDHSLSSAQRRSHRPLIALTSQTRNSTDEDVPSFSLLIGARKVCLRRLELVNLK